MEHALHRKYTFKFWSEDEHHDQNLLLNILRSQYYLIEKYYSHYKYKAGYVCAHGKIYRLCS